MNQTNCKKTYKTILTCSLVLLVVSFAAQLYVSNRLAVKGKEMVALTQKHAQLQKELSEMKLQASENSSLAYIEQRAYEQGLVPNTQSVLTISTITTTAVVPSL